MKRRAIVTLLAIICLVAVSGISTKAYYTGTSGNGTYVYNENGQAVSTLDAYTYSKSIDLREIDGYTITNLVDMCVTDDGDLYVLESTLGVIFCFDENQNYLYCIDSFTMPDGSATSLNYPQGIFVNSEDVLYIADTQNQRVLICDLEGNISQIVTTDGTILGTSTSNFLPTKVVADSAGRISVVATNINQGIMQFTKSGDFSGYVGAPSVKVGAFARLLRRFYTEEQRASMTTYVPTEYNNIKIDSNNFIWGTISALSSDDLADVVSSKDLSGSTTPIVKLNMKGSDVLVRKGDYAPIGDLEWYETPSKIVDVGLGPNDTYTLLDSTEGRMFTYNSSGILLFAFGGNGTEKGATQNPIAIDYVGDKILVLDSGLCSIQIYEPTTYGSLLVDAEGYYSEGEYDLANDAWQQAAEMNSTFSYPYIGLGNAEYENGNYETAMVYYEYANNSSNYSKAKEALRKSSLSVTFPYIVAVIGILAVVFIGKGIGRRVMRYVRGEQVTYGEEDDE